MAGRIGRSKRVRRVDANTSTGSLLVTFDPDDPIDLIVEDLRAIGLEVAEVIAEARQLRTQSTGAAVVRNVIGKANAKLHESTSGHLDLRLAVPAIYLTLAVRNFLHHRARIRDASWYQLAYWAFDSFFKLHEEPTTATRARSHGRLVN